MLDSALKLEVIEALVSETDLSRSYDTSMYFTVVS